MGNQTVSTVIHSPQTKTWYFLWTLANEQIIRCQKHNVCNMLTQLVWKSNDIVKQRKWRKVKWHVENSIMLRMSQHVMFKSLTFIQWWHFFHETLLCTYLQIIKLIKVCIIKVSHAHIYPHSIQSAITKLTVDMTTIQGDSFSWSNESNCYVVQLNSQFAWTKCGHALFVDVYLRPFFSVLDFAFMRLYALNQRYCFNPNCWHYCEAIIIILRMLKALEYCWSCDLMIWFISNWMKLR